MGKLIKSKLRKIAIASSNFFDVSFLGETGPEIKTNFPEPLKLPKTPQQAFSKDMKKIATDFNKAVASFNVKGQ